MFSLYDFAEVGACFTAFFTMLFVLVRKPRHISAHFYTLATLTTLLFWIAFIIILSEDVLSRFEHGILVSLLSLMGSAWILFLLTFARETPDSSPRNWSLLVWGVVALFLAAAIVGFFQPYFDIRSLGDGKRILSITLLGRYLLGLLIISCAFALLQLENTFRAATGSIRRALILPAGSFILLLAVILVSASLGLLYTYIKFSSIQLGALVSIVMMILISRFLVFEDRQNHRVVLSRQAIYSSVGILLVGAYLVLVGLTIKLLTMLGGSPEIFFSALAALVLVVFTLALLLSSSLKTRVRRLVDRSMLAGRIDLPTELSSFADDVTAVVDKQEMFCVTDRVLKEKCGLTEVVIMLRGKKKGEFIVSYPVGEGSGLQLPAVEDWLLRSGRMTAVDEMTCGLTEGNEVETTFLAQVAGGYFIPLVARQEFVGIISCRSQGRIGSDARLLIETLSHQLALSLLSAKQYEALVEAKELASFSKVSSFVIHDVKNLLSMLSLILQNAEKKFHDPRFQQSTIDTLVSAQVRMKRMIGRLSAPAQQVDFPITDCDLKKVVLDLLEEMKLAGNRKVTMQLAIPELPLVRGNVGKFKSILGNLLINALEAMPNGGELRIHADQDREYVTITVKDNGQGISEEFIREKLFRPFQTSKPNGLGIGLFQSKELAEQMDGQLTVVSTINEGSAFILKVKKHD